jgi:hypothetical protein
VDLAVGLPCQAHLRKDGLVDGIGDYAAEVVGVGLCELGGIGNANDALRWIMAEIPGRQRDGSDDRLQMALRRTETAEAIARAAE